MLVYIKLGWQPIVLPLEGALSMENSMSRILIETTVRQTLKGLRENPKRSIRNLVDMALQFSEGRFQSRFFETARTMLENENSAYYALVADAASHIETEHLVKFGMNLGYNSFTWGAQYIRYNEEQLGFNIPWTVLLQMDPSGCLEHMRQYDITIEEGEGLGIYSWMLFTLADPSSLLPLVRRHSDSAFFLFCPPQAVTGAFLEKISPIRHLMPVIRYEDAAKDACILLREVELPYAVYYPYSGENVDFITSGGLFRGAQRLHPIFTVLVPEPGCPANISEIVHRAAVEARAGQSYQTVPWELYHDTRKLDEIISNDACYVLFDRGGNLCTSDESKNSVGGNLFTEGLTPLLRRTCPKSTSVSVT